MTGYGEASWQDEQCALHVTIKTLNSRYFDLNLRFPSLFWGSEIWWRKELQQCLQRGKVMVSLSCESYGVPNLSFDTKAIHATYAILANLAEQLHADTDMLGWLLNKPGIIKLKQPALQPAHLVALNKVMTEAIAQCIASRKHEGEQLTTQLRDAIAQLIALKDEVEQCDKERGDMLKHKHDTGSSYCETCQNGGGITEEKVRLTSHLAFFDKIMKTGEGGGKKLDFLAQEMGREVNTIAAKAQHATLQHVVVQMKEILEQVREQLHNVR